MRVSSLEVPWEEKTRDGKVFWNNGLRSCVARVWNSEMLYLDGVDHCPVEMFSVWILITLPLVCSSS